MSRCSEAWLLWQNCKYTLHTYIPPVRRAHLGWYHDMLMCREFALFLVNLMLGPSCTCPWPPSLQCSAAQPIGGLICCLVLTIRQDLSCHTEWRGDEGERVSDICHKMDCRVENDGKAVLSRSQHPKKTAQTEWARRRVELWPLAHSSWAASQADLLYYLLLVPKEGWMYVKIKWIVKSKNVPATKWDLVVQPG